MKCFKCPKNLSFPEFQKTIWIKFALISTPQLNQLVLLVRTSWACLLWCCDVIYFSDLVVPLSCVKVQLQSVTEMDSAVNLPHQSPQTHSLCHWYPAATSSFSLLSLVNTDRWMDWISLISCHLFQISHKKGFLLYLCLSRSLLAVFNMNTNDIATFP